MSILVFTQQQRTQGIVCTCQGPEWVYVCIVWQSLQSRVKQAVLERVTEQWSEILICTEHIGMLKGKPHERELFPTIVKMKKVTCMYITTAGFMQCGLRMHHVWLIQHLCSAFFVKLILFSFVVNYHT